MRALITGASGFVGPHLCEHLLAQGDEVSGFLFGAPKRLPDSVVLFAADVRDPAAVQQAFERIQPEAVYHLAAISSIAAARANPRLTFEVNVVGTFNVFDAARQLTNPPRLLNVSTSQVYSQVVDSITEASPICPPNAYAASKAIAEQVPRLFSDADCVTVRPFNHSGPGQTTDFVLASLAAQIAEMEAGFRPPVLQVGDLDVERDFLDVRDVVRAYRLLILRGRRGHVYNVASGAAYSVRSIIETFQSLARVRFEVRSDPSRHREGQPQHVSANPVTLKADTGWHPEIPIEIMLGDLLAYWRAVQDNASVPSDTAGH